MKLLSLSRAARLVGQSRGTLQKQIQDGGLASFEGKISLEHLTQLYPNAGVEDNVMLEKIEEIIERARFKARNHPAASLDHKTLAIRVSLLSDELALARQEVGNHTIFMDKLKSKLKSLAAKTSHDGKAVLTELQSWVEEQAAALPTTISPAQRQLLAQDTVLRIMAAQVQLRPSGHEFLVEGNNTLLESGLGAGFALNYGCSNGNCGMCKAKIISGKVKKVRQHDYALTEAEKAQDTILMCSHTALTDLVLETEEAGTAEDIPKQSISGWLKKQESASDKISILNIRTPRTKRLRFLAGQRAKLTTEQGNTIELPIASCPCDEINLQFHIDTTKSDSFTQEVTEGFKTGAAIEICGPEGEFILREEPPHPFLFMAMDTGFAPIKSLIEHAMTLDVAESLHLYWFTTNATVPYLDNLCRAWDDAFENFSYHTIPCEQFDANNAQSCQQQFNRIAVNHADLGNYQAYIAGPKAFVIQAEEFCRQQEVDDQYITTEIL